MDYNKALFAVHVRQLATDRLNQDMPPNLDYEAKTAYMLENFEGAVESVLAEIDWTMRTIDKQGA